MPAFGAGDMSSNLIGANKIKINLRANNYKYNRKGGIIMDKSLVMGIIIGIVIGIVVGILISKMFVIY